MMQNSLVEIWAPLAPLFAFAIPILTLIVAFVIGSWQERKHFASLKEDEARYADIMVTDLKRLPSNWQVKDAVLVCGEVVIANDKFKLWMAGWVNLFGGRVFTYETLLERARREAIVRMQREANELGANAVWNVRILTAMIGGGVEAMAFGTAVTADLPKGR